MPAENERSERFAKICLQRFEEMRAQRSGREPEFQQITDYIFPRRDFTLTREPQALRSRRLMDTTGMVSHERLSAILFGYMLSPHAPWTQPRLLMRDASYEEDAWFDHVSDRMHRWFSQVSNTFRTAMAEDVLDITGFGSSVSWQERSKNGPVYLAVPMKQCFWTENEQGVIDTVYREYEMTLRRAVLRWPDSAGLRELAGQTQRPESQMVSILHVVEPREDGRRGAVRDRKPFRDVSILRDKSEVLEVGGHDRLKYNVGRFQRRTGDPYGYGAAWKALPFCKVASAAMEAWVRNAEKAADPSLWTMLPRSTQFDRRPGAVNFINPLLAAGMRDMSQLIQRLEQSGDTGVTVELLQHVHVKIEQAMYVDWLMPNEGPQKTATEVYDLRDLRLRTMGPIVARLEQEKMNQMVEDTFEDLQDMGFFNPPPASLNDEMIVFEFKGPLAISQRTSEAEGIMRAVQGGMSVAQLDPSVTMMFEGESLVRAITDSYGLNARHLASPKVYQERREAQRQMGEMQEEMQATQTAATAIRDGAQGVASLAAVTGAGQGAA